MSEVRGGSRTPIHRLNPVTKLVALLAILVIAFALPYWWVSALLVLLVVIPVAIIGRVIVPLMKIAAVMLLPILLALFAVQGLTFPGAQTILFEWRIIKVSREGLDFALGIGSRVTAMVLGALLFVLTTHPSVLMGALTDKGMSPKFAYIIASTFQLVPAFKDRADAILLAQQARGLKLGGGLGSRVKVMLPLLSPLVLGMFTDVEERSTAMEVRAFGSTAKRTSLIPVPDSTGEKIARWLMGVAALAAIGAQVTMGILG